MAFAFLFEILRHQQESNPLSDAFTAKKNGQWQKYSTSEVLQKVDEFSLGLLASGITEGDKVAIISPNRPEWIFLDLALQQIKAVSVPLYTHVNPDELKFIFNHAEIKAAFVSGKDVFKKLTDLKNEFPQLQTIYSFDDAESLNKLFKYQPKPNDLQNLDKIKATIKEDDLVTIIYNSGEGGQLKGVMLSHKNIVSNVKSLLQLIPENTAKKALSFLPLNHAFERMITYLYMAAGVSIYYAESIERIAPNIKEIKPDIFTTVPRLLERVYEKIISTGSRLKGLSKWVFLWSLNLAKNYEYSGKSKWYYLQLALARRFVFNKWRAALGGNIKAIVSGGAALNPELARVFTAAGIPVLQGYGLTEASPVVAVNTFKITERKFGTVGKALENVEVKIADDGEILVKGPNVMLGYYKNPEETAQTIDENGWLHTGDIGEIDEEYFLKITDRKKSLFKTSGGEYVAPLPIENKLKESPFIDNAMIVGEGKKMVTVLIAPDFRKLKEWSAENGIATDNTEDLIKNEKVINLYKAIIDGINEHLNHTEQIKKFVIVPDKWTVETEEITPTLKLNRDVLKEKYAELIKKMYS